MCVRAFDLFIYTYLFLLLFYFIVSCEWSSSCRAVVWADFIQFVLMMFSIATVAVLGMDKVGGFTNVWSAAERGGRLILFK